MSESWRAVDCFGGHVSVRVASDAGHSLRTADLERMDLTLAIARLLEIHTRLTRFSEKSELSRLNADPRQVVPASPLVRRFAAAVRWAGHATGGLVDATTIDAVEAAGYRQSLRSRREPDPQALLVAGPPPRPANADPAARWRQVEVDEQAGTIARPPGLRLDSGGLAKGMAADLIAESLRGRATWAVDCAGDIRFGGVAGLPRSIEVRDPYGGPPLRRLELVDGAVATSGVTARAWIGSDGRPRHHLIDPGRASLLGPA